MAIANFQLSDKEAEILRILIRVNLGQMETKDDVALLNLLSRLNALQFESLAVSELELHVASKFKIEAIKMYRQRTGAGLKEGKDAVETAMSTLLEALEEMVEAVCFGSDDPAVERARAAIAKARGEK